MVTPPGIEPGPAPSAFIFMVLLTGIEPVSIP